MNDVAFKTSQHVNDRVRLAYVRQKLIAQSLALAGALDESCYIHEFQLRRHDFGRAADLRDDIKTGVRHEDAADVRLNRAERKIRRLRRGCSRQCVKQRGLSHIRQPDYSAIKTHLFFP